LLTKAVKMGTGKKDFVERGVAFIQKRATKKRGRRGGGVGGFW